jgi:hypothetical protein
MDTDSELKKQSNGRTLFISLTTIILRKRSGAQHKQQRVYR